MDLFKKEAVFAENLSEDLQEKIYLYEKKATFLKLRDEEKLGSYDAPFPLSFLKYMIDFNEEQSINNLLETLGNSFFVANDLEVGNKIFYIELKRQASRWQISILKQKKEI